MKPTFTYHLVVQTGILMCLSLTSLAQNGIWTNKAGMPTARKEVANATVAIEDKVYVVGGVARSSSITNALEVYDAVNNSWSSLASLPIAVWRASASSVNGKLYVFGGYLSTGAFPFNPTNRVFEYDPATDQWTEKRNMPTARGAHTAIAANGKIHVIGGATNSASNEHQIYDPAADTWSIAAAMPTGRSGLTGVKFGNELFLFGGYFLNNGVISQSKVEAYNLTTNSWRTLNDMPVARLGIDAAVLDDKIYVVGGATSATVPSRTLEFDPVASTWRQMLDMPSPVSFMGVEAANDTIFAIGGGPVNLNRTDGQNTNRAFDPMGVVTSIEISESSTGEMRLSNAYPNPFQKETNIHYTITKTGHVKLTLSNMAGHEEAVLVDDVKSPGEHSIRFKPDFLSSGIYILRLTIGSNVMTKKLLKQD